MNEEIDEKNKNDFYYLYVFLSIIFCISNVISSVISHYLTDLKKPNLKKLRYKLLALIIIDSIVLIIFSIYRPKYNTFVIELFFSALYSLEFFLFFSFFLQILNSIRISELAQKKELINPTYLCLVFLLSNFPYYKYSILYPKIIYALQYIIILFLIGLLYNYLDKSISGIARNLESRDVQNKMVCYYLRVINTLGLLLLTVYDILKLTIIFMNTTKYVVYIELGTYTINQGLKFSVYILLFILIYTLNNNKYYQNIFEERIGINQKNN